MPIAITGYWFIKSDTRITIKGLLDESDAPVNDATITAVLKSKLGVTVPGAENIIFQHVAGSDGNYTGIVPSIAQLVRQEPYELIVTIARGANKVTAKMRRRAKYLAG